MNDICFRVWDKEKKIMRYQVGLLIEVEDDSRWCSTYVAIGEANPNENATLLNESKVEVMGYTGLHDKNGTRIFKSDILKHEIWGNSEIIWEHGMFRGVGSEHDITLADHQLQRSRVIGNRYQNPNLLPIKNE